MLKTRLITAFILIPLVLLALWMLPKAFFSLLVLLIAAMMAWEWSRLAGLITVITRCIYVFISLAACFAMRWLPLSLILWVAVLIWLWAALVVCRYQNNLEPLAVQYPWVKGGSGVVMLACTYQSILVLRDIHPLWLLLALLIVWLADSGAYFSGKLWGQGRAALASRISPKKTWVGFWGGFITAVVLVTAVSYFFSMPWLERLLLMLVIVVSSIFSVIGDLFISVLKRMVSVKDSGNLLPGHGGLLDRLDSLLAAAPLFTVGVWLLVH